MIELTAAQATALACRRIEENDASKDPILDLGDLPLEHLPESIGKLGHLRVLGLGKREPRWSEGRYSWVWKSERPIQFFRDLAPLTALTGLTSLDLSGCEGLIDLAPLAALIGLTALDLWGCRGVRDLAPLTALTGLTSLDLSYCTGFTDLAPLAELTGLNSLNLKVCRRISDLDPLGTLTKLTSLNLKVCRGVRDLAPLATLTRLTSLEISYCTGFGDLAPLASLTRLTSLDLHGCRAISDLAPLATLIRLTSLDLSYCTGFGDLSPLAALTRLTTLDLQGCGRVRDLAPLVALTELTSLNLQGCGRVRDLAPLVVLTELTSLDLTGCSDLGDLSPLAALAGLTLLDLTRCRSVSDLAPLAALTGLTSLDLTLCKGVRRFQPIQSLLGHLARLYLHECSFDDVPAHLYGTTEDDNVAEPVRRHYEAITTQSRGEDVECKVLVVGNGAGGKTSLVRLILGEAHRDNEPTTHAIHLGAWQTDLLLQGNDAPVPARINIWDFGGQDLYHETHRLFFQTGVVYLVVWDPWELERTDHNAGEWYPDKKRSLQYWIDQIVAADPQARILVVRNKADLDGSRVDPDWREQLPRHQEAIHEGRIQFVRLSAKDRSVRNRAERGNLFAWLAAAVAAVLGGPEKRAAGEGRLAVKAVVRGWQEKNDEVIRANEVGGEQKTPLPYPFITRALFDQIVRENCAGSLDAEDTSYVLQWLHRTGAIFWNEALFGERILIDQRWAIQGIYTLLDRELAYPRLQTAHGRFTAAHLARWAWDAAGYSPEEQRLFLEFMQACGLCFLLLRAQEAPDGRALYVAPEYLPGEDNPSISDRRSELHRGLGDGPTVEVCAAHPALGEGVAQAMINRIGAKWSRSAVLWRWGAAFASGDPKVQAVAEVSWSPLPGQEREFGGQMRVTVWGTDAPAFLGPIVATLRELPPFPKEATFGPSGDDGDSQAPDEPILVRVPGLDDVAPSRAGAVGRCVSFSVAGTRGMPPAEARLQESLPDQLKALARKASYRLIHYKHEPEDLPEKLDALMHEIARGDLVLIFLSERYLFSKFCMTELVLIYDHAERGRFPKDQTKLWRLPSAEKHLDSEQRTGQGVSEEVIRFWREQLSAFDSRVTTAVGDTTGARSIASVYERKKRRDPCWEFFEFMGDETQWDEFLTALTNHAFENSPLSQGNESKEAVEAFAAKTAEEIHKIMTTRGYSR